MAGAPLSEVIYSAVKPIIRMYLIIGSGIFLARTGLLSVAVARSLSDLVLMVFMPALVFDKVVNYISISDIKTIAVIVLSAVIMYCLNAVVAAGIVLFTPVPKGKKDRWVGGALLAGIMQNVSDLPIAYLQAMSMLTTKQSEKGTAYVIIWLAMYVMAQFNCGLFQLVEADFKYVRKHADDPESDTDVATQEKEVSQIPTSSTDDTQDVSEHSSISSLASDQPDQMPVRKVAKYTESKQNVTKKQKSKNVGSSANANGAESISDSVLNPISPTSTISTDAMSSDVASLESDPRIVNRLRSVATRQASLIKRTTTKAGEMLSPRTAHPAIARLPSMRSLDYDTYNRSINEQMDPVSIYGDDPRVRRLGSRGSNQQETLADELVREYSHVEPHNQNVSTLANIVTETQLSHKDIDAVSKKIPLAQKYKPLKFLLFFIANFKKPSSVALIIALICALIPWIKALFVNGGTVHISNAPDNQPALSFLLMYAEYLGLPCVPLGLLLIGSILGRLQVSDMPKGFWKCIMCHTVYRLGILPIIGILWVNKMHAIHWLDDPMAMLVCCIEFALPSATVQIYITASCMRPGQTECASMNCLALYIITQYAFLCVTLPVVVCYTIKDVIHF